MFKNLIFLKYIPFVCIFRHIVLNFHQKTFMIVISHGQGRVPVPVRDERGVLCRPRPRRPRGHPQRPPEGPPPGSRGQRIHSVHLWHGTLRKRIKTEEKAKVLAAAGGMELIQFHAAPAIVHQDDPKKRMNRIMATWQNGCFEKSSGSHHTKTSPPGTLSKWMLSQKLFFKSSLLLNG